MEDKSNDISPRKKENSEKKMKLGFGMCGSFCTLKAAIEELNNMKKLGWTLIPIINESVQNTDTRFGMACDIISDIEKISECKPITSIKDAEPLGPNNPLDVMVIAPCTGNTIAKLANGITDSPVTMAAKAHLRSDRPLVIAIASNDALSGNLKNIAALAQRKNIYFVPVRQDDYAHKPHSLVADYSFISNTVFAAMSGIQLQPVIIQ